ncbi:MAG: phosphoribosylamine--glycine ligase [Gaiellales bacterium]
MRVLIVGSGGREHALAWALARSPSVTELHAARGNPGIADLAHCHPVVETDGDALVGLCRAHGIDLVVVGPEVPLVAGVADTLRHQGISVFGPGADAARIEGSKRFAKELMEAAGVPTARRLEVPSVPCVLKADGLAAGKGVVLCRTDAEVEAGLEVVRGFGGDVVVEELLEGPEVSFFAVCDGADGVALPVATDFKRAHDGDQGPNTGGMGSFAPVPDISGEQADQLLDVTVRPVLEALSRQGTPFVGVLFVGLMLTAAGPRVLEYNCRFGDPETQSVLPLLDGDLAALLAAAAAGQVGGVDIGVSDRAAVTVVVTGEDYPAAGLSGVPILGIDEATAAGALVFHAGTALEGGRLVAAGGRILNVTATGRSVAEARATAYRALTHLELPGSRFRSDIAAAAGA